MASTAFQTLYRQEFINAFEIRQSLLRSSVTTAAEINGNAAVFLVAGSGGATAVTRGVSGLIPSRSDDLTQSTATIAEWHDLVQRTGFNIESSQSDGRRIMQMTSMGVINRKIDADIIAQLDAGTLYSGSTATATLAMVAKAKAVLGNNEVPIDDIDNMFGLISPAMDAYLMQVAQYSSADYIEVKPFEGPSRKYRRWYGVNWIVHPNITGVGTNAEKCYIFHRDAIGHAVNKGIRTAVGYEDQHDYSYARTSVYMGSKLLQNTGVFRMVHDGSAYVSS